MDYEKKYKEALERARKCWGEYNDIVGAYENKGVCEEIFPELKENEDEKIRNFLISKMKEVGNVWKEYSAKDIIAYLEKQGKQKEDNPPFNDPKYLAGFDTGRKVQKIFDEQNPPEWSEEDEKLINRIEGWLTTLCEYLKDENSFKCVVDVKDVIEKLKSLKDRIQPQSKREWSEKDELMLGKCIDAASGYYSPEDKQSMKDWLYFLKQRYIWKPSDEQMTALRRMKAAIAGEGEIYKPLNLLYEDLKKLREE